ncbi:MAG TPA: hypothetical protein VGS07_10310 [Thermoanaerobaculia bacterium]|jgi:hypothetical protein|nr:hypothetical protein [Thermoanaerobaculia bacterium]
MMKRFFLSASVPDPQRDPKYFETADHIAIRDAVRALAMLVLPEHLLIWGGHPAITPMIRIIAESLGAPIQDHVWLYQSEYFRPQAPVDNQAFGHIIWTQPVDGDRQRSLKAMRLEMLSSQPFDAGVFIGGMEGVEEEFELFRQHQPKARAFPVASTGGAALQLFNLQPESFPRDLLVEQAYLPLFRRLLGLSTTAAASPPSG